MTPRTSARSIALAFAATLLAVAFTACGGGSSNDAQPTGTETASRSTAQPTARSTTVPATATATSTTAPSATPQPSPTPVPSPTPAEIVFSSATGGSGTASGQHTGLFGIVYADANWNAIPQSSRAQAYAFVNAGISETPAASAWVFNDFTAPDLGSSSVQAQISADVSWQGVLAGNGIGGTLASVDITLRVLDGNRTIASQEVHSNELRESALTVGGYDDVGSAPANFTASLVPGRRYRVQLRVDCEARSGILAAATHCIFGPSDLYNTGFVEWTGLSILFN